MKMGGDKGVFITSKHVLRHHCKDTSKGPLPAPLNWAQVVCT